MIVARNLPSERAWIGDDLLQCDAERDDTRRDVRVAQGHFQHVDKHLRLVKLREAALTEQGGAVVAP